MIDTLLPPVMALAMLAIYYLGQCLWQTTWLSLALGLFLGPVVGFWLVIGVALALYWSKHRDLEVARQHLKADASSVETYFELAWRTGLCLLVLGALLTIMGQRQRTVMGQRQRNQPVGRHRQQQDAPR